MMPLPPAAQPLSRTQSRVSLHMLIFGIPAPGVPAAPTPVSWPQSTKSTHSDALSQVRQAAEVIALQSRPQLLTVSFASQTSGPEILPSPHTGTSGMTSLQVASQVVPLGLPGG